VTISAPQGDYSIDCDYLIAADGHRSSIRHILQLDFKGRVFEDHFLIADIRMNADFPAERRFWFDPPFNPGQTTLLHKQADGIWRLDFQVGAGAIDRQQILSEENIERLVRGVIGPEIDFECAWKSLYTFHCRRMDEFVHGRVIFVGDAAHLVSPFGARGANGGIQDVDNLCWKLALLLKGQASCPLLDSYNFERTRAADENILNSSRSTDFLSPKSAVGRAFRDATLKLASEMPFARAFVNSGRLSVPCVVSDSPLNTPDSEEFRGPMVPGSACMDAPVGVNGTMDWFLSLLGGCFTLVVFSGDGATDIETDGIGAPLGITLSQVVVGARPSSGAVHDVTGLLAQHYDAAPGTVYLVRPDQHVCARWRAFDGSRVHTALQRAIGAAQSPELTIRRTGDESIRIRG
ncbi:MAG: FAD-dependent monooxygenase, partial [Gammaproteobacteria bacterium]|nr:FAD-dependent monooxygenase [Gammaproteobacteria bacterium]